MEGHLTMHCVAPLAAEIKPHRPCFLAPTGASPVLSHHLGAPPTLVPSSHMGDFRS